MGDEKTNLPNKRSFGKFCLIALFVILVSIK